MKRTVLFITIFISLIFIDTQLLLSQKTETDKRLDEIEKLLNEYEEKGEAPPQALLDEMQELMNKAEKSRDSEDDESMEEMLDLSNVSFSGTITITKILTGSGKLSDSGNGSLTWEMTSNGKMEAFITQCLEMKDKDKVIGYQPVGYIQGNITEKEIVTGVDYKQDSKYNAEKRIDFPYNQEINEGFCELKLNPAKKTYTIDILGMRLDNSKGKTMLTIGESIKVIDYNGINPEIYLDASLLPVELKYNPTAGVINGTYTYTKPADLDGIRKIIANMPKDTPGYENIVKDFEKNQPTLKSISGLNENVYTITLNLKINSKVISQNPGAK